MSRNFYSVASGISGALAVGLGAVGAHSMLRKPETYRDVWKVPYGALAQTELTRYCLDGEPLPPRALLRPGGGGPRACFGEEKKRLRRSLPLRDTALLRLMLRRRRHGAAQAIRLPCAHRGTLLHRRMGSTRIDVICRRNLA